MNQRIPDVTVLLDRVNAGDAGASAELMNVIYAELHRLATSKMRAERGGHTLQPTVLVNEAYLRLAKNDVRWENRAHFFGAAAEAMRRILIEHARARLAEKRGGGAERVTFDDIQVAADDPDVDVIALSDAIDALRQENERLCDVVMLRYFGGLSIEQTAETLDVSPATVKRDWNYARAWLYERMIE